MMFAMLLMLLQSLGSEELISTHISLISTFT